MTEQEKAERNDELLRLIESCCNSTISDEEFARLEERLNEDRHARAFYRRYMNLDSALQEYGDVTGKGWYTASLDELNAIPRSRLVLRIASVCAVVCLLIAAVMAGFLLRNRGTADQRPVIGQLENLVGTVMVARDDADARTVENGEPIRAGETIRTADAESSVTFVFPDGSRLNLPGNTSLTCPESDGRTVIVRSGGLTAIVKRQPKDQPLTIRTPHDRLAVSAAEFQLQVTKSGTTLTVGQGHVVLTRASDGKSVDVAAGYRLVSGERSVLKPERSDKPQAVWAEDFERGLPRNWKLGRFVNSGLPGGSQGAVQAVTVRDQNGLFHVIASPDRPADRFFHFEPGLHIEVICKMANPNWINIFLFTKKKGTGKSEFAGNYLYNEIPFVGMKPNRWYSLTVPITKFRRLFPFTGGQFDGVEPYQISFSSTGEDRGLVIDEVRVTRGGPGRIVLKETR